MIKEAYCSFEVAKLLKDKGFVELCLYYYFSDGIKMYKSKGLRHRNSSSVSTYSTPTHQMAMKWLRETYDIFIVIRRGLTGTGWVYSHEIYKDSQCLYARYGASYDTYEEAVEAALKYCLENLI